MGTVEDVPERPNNALGGDKLAFDTGEDPGDLQGLQHEPLDLMGTLDLGGRRIRNDWPYNILMQNSNENDLW